MPDATKGAGTEVGRLAAGPSVGCGRKRTADRHGRPADHQSVGAAACSAPVRQNGLAQNQRRRQKIQPITATVVSITPQTMK